MVKRTFPRHETITWQQADNIVGLTRSKQFKCPEGPLGVEIEQVKTLRKTKFGRATSTWLIDGITKFFVYFASDFQEAIIEDVKNDPNLHLFIDGTFKICPFLYEQLLNIWVFHRGKKLYIPVTHVLMQSTTIEAYKIVLQWFDKNFNLKPKFVTIDFEASLMQCVKIIYPNAHIVPWFFHFVKCLWTNAGKWGLRKYACLPLTKQFIFDLKALAFKPITSVIKQFERIKTKYSKNKSKPFSQFLEYFESTWIDG